MKTIPLDITTVSLPNIVASKEFLWTSYILQGWEVGVGGRFKLNMLTLH